MTVNIGLKQLKKIKKGSTPIMEIYKGSDLIFEDFEEKYAFKMTVSIPANNKTFAFDDDAYYYNENSVKVVPTISVDWGDGTTTSEAARRNISHTYSAAGTYHITILPTDLVGSRPMKGWLSGFGYHSSGTTTASSYATKIISFDTRLPERSACVLVNTPLSDRPNTFYGNMGFYNIQNITSAPTDFFKNVEPLYDPSVSYTTFGVSFANSMFRAFGKTSKFDAIPMAQSYFRKFKNVPFKSTISSSNSYAFYNTFFEACVESIPADLFDFDLTGMYAGYQMFQSTFLRCVHNATSLTIPEGLLDCLEGASFNNISGMFMSMFQEAGIANIPADLFSKLDTSNAMSLGETFRSTFMTNPLVSSIPATLFDNLTTSQMTYFGTAFLGTFQGIGTNSSITTGSIPSGLFDSVDTSSATDTSNMFVQTFQGSFSYSTNATIPSGLFDSIDTSSSTSARAMFSGTFSGYGIRSTTGAIPSDLFKNIDFSRNTNFSSMFSNTFNNFATENTSCPFPNGIFDNINATNIVNGNYMFQQTFAGYGKKSTTGYVSGTLLNNIRTNNVTNAEYMFSKMFYGTLKDSTESTFPVGIFDNVTLENVTSLNYTFESTFREFCYSATDTTIPSGIFANLDTSKVTNFNMAFSSTFTWCGYSSTTAAFPTGIFDLLDTSKATNFQYTFQSTFAGICYSSPTATIPSGVFDFLDTTSVTQGSSSFMNTFAGTFASCCYSSLVATIPSGLFNKVPFLGGYMFQGTFTNCCYSSPVATIPSDLFRHISVLDNSDLKYAFDNTFKGCCYSSTAVALPSKLFPVINTQTLNNCDYLFRGTFESFCQAKDVTIPVDLFDGIDLTSLQYTTSTYGLIYRETFNRTFANFRTDRYPAGLFSYVKFATLSPYHTFEKTFWLDSPMQVEIEDVFSGMDNYAWADPTGQTTYWGESCLAQTFSIQNNQTDQSTGQAAPIIAHFPNVTSRQTGATFRNRTGLSDYASIPNIWK